MPEGQDLGLTGLMGLALVMGIVIRATAIPATHRGRLAWVDRVGSTDEGESIYSFGMAFGELLM